MSEFLADRILFDGEPLPISLPAVDHYAGVERFMYKAVQLQQAMAGLFDVTLDFEDGSAAGQEREQAELIATVLAEAAHRDGRLGIRIHDASSPFWRMQCEHVISAGRRLPDYVTLPKVTGIAQVQAVARHIAALSEQAGLQQRIALHVMVESPGVLPELESIVRLPNVECVSFGLLDYVSSFAGALPMSLIESPNEFDSPLINDAKVRISTLCQAHGKVASHSLCSDLVNAEVVAAHARKAFGTLGFRRMWSIHPNQIEPILQASRPEPAVVARAAQVLANAAAHNWAPIRHEDRLHDRASYRYFWCVLKSGYLSGVELPACAVPLFASGITKERGHVRDH